MKVQINPNIKIEKINKIHNATNKPKRCPMCGYVMDENESKFNVVCSACLFDSKN